MIASATGRSVPGRTGRWRSARRASGVARGSTTTSFAPASRARSITGTRWMPVACGFVPHTHDQLRVRVVLERDARHRADDAALRRAGRRRAVRAIEVRRAEPAEEPRRERALGEPAVRAAVVIRQDRRAAVRSRICVEPLGDVIERLRPTVTRSPRIVGCRMRSGP